VALEAANRRPERRRPRGAGGRARRGGRRERLGQEHTDEDHRRPDGARLGTVERTGSLGYCPQLPLLWDKLTVAEHFELYARAYGLDRERAASALDQLLDELQFARYRDYRIEDLSGGTRQKVNLSISLMHDPDLLLLDEPYTGFDWETYLKFWELSESRRDRGMAILIVTHMITENKRLDRVLNLREGRIEAS
jgi:ABC-2 type transport system ATP-binding protein